MFYLIRILILIVIFIPAPSFSRNYCENPGFFVLTVPKAGSFLIMKLLVMLTNQNPAPCMIEFPQLGGFFFPEDGSEHQIMQEELEFFCDKWKNENSFSLAHFNFSNPFFLFSIKHPEYIKILQIRDLRDTLVSCAFFQSKEIEEETGFTVFDDMLMYLIRKNKTFPSPKIINIYRHAKNALEWVKEPNVFVCRFEDIVGVKGGGNLEIQQKNIVMLANLLNISLTQVELNEISNDLFGIDKGYGMTFREGKIGSWKQFFKEEHIKAFEEEGWVDLQLGLGYPLDW